MKAKEKGEKSLIRLRYAVALEKALKASKFNSFRDLALHIGFEPSHIQRISSGKVDVVLTTNISLAEGFDLTFAQLSAFYDKVTQDDMNAFLKEKEAKRKGLKRSKIKEDKKK
jgi:hypothetical protein